MFENIKKFFKKANSKEAFNSSSKDKAKERLHLVLMQDRANVSADFLDLMRQEIIEVIKKYIDIDENAMDVRLTNQANDDGTQGAPALYANIPIVNIKEKARKAKLEVEKVKEINKEAENKIEEAKRIEEVESKKEEVEEDVVEEVVEAAVEDKKQNDSIKQEENENEDAEKKESEKIEEESKDE